MRASRASAIAVLGAVGFVLVGVWGVLNLSEGDWFIGVGMTASAVVGLWSLVVRVLQERRRRVGSAAPTSPRSGQVPEPHR